MGWVDYAKVEQLCAQQGFSERTMRRAKTVLNLRCLRVGKPPNNRAFWYQAEQTEEAVLADILGQHEQLALCGQKSGTVGHS